MWIAGPARRPGLVVRGAPVGGRVGEHDVLAVRPRRSRRTARGRLLELAGDGIGERRLDTCEHAGLRRGGREQAVTLDFRLQDQGGWVDG